MNFITALEIATNYPNGDIMTVGAQHKETGKWTSLMYLMRDGEIHKLMLSFDINENFAGWDTEKEAVDKMEEMAQFAIQHIENLHKDDK